MPQPIDIHTEIARVDATTRVQQVADRAALTAQHRFSMEAEERRAETETNVVEKDEIDGEHLDSEHRRSQHERRRRAAKKAGDEHAPSDGERMALRNTDEGTKLDVSI
jgi:hypothetical protein